MPEIDIKTIGEVMEGFQTLHDIHLFENSVSKIMIYEDFYDAMFLMDRNSYFWVLSWLHLSDRQVLRASPRWIEKLTVEFGVFGLRSPSRPNPIGLSLVKLISKTENVLTVSGLDLLTGTPILDIKPYSETDAIFSPKAPYMRPKDDRLRYDKLYMEAMHFHQEDCLDLQIALKMAIIAEKTFLTLSSDDLFIEVNGTKCLLDTIQGLTRSRFANPARLSFIESNNKARTIWNYHNRILTITLKTMQDLKKETVKHLNENNLFDIQWETV